MNKIKKTLRMLTELKDVLESFADREPISPEVGSFYLTFNNSVVYVFSAEGNEYFDPTQPVSDEHNWEQVFSAVILVGGHGIPSINGEKPIDVFTVGGSGYMWTHSEVGPELVLSLREKLPFDLKEYL